MLIPRSKMMRAILGVGTLLPLPAVAVVLFAIFDPLAWFQGEGWAADWFWLAWTFCLGAFAIGALISFYYMAVVMGSDADQAERNFWLMTLWSFYPIVGPIFWYRVIWKGQTVYSATIRA